MKNGQIIKYFRGAKWFSQPYKKAPDRWADEIQVMWNNKLYFYRQIYLNYV